MQVAAVIARGCPDPTIPASLCLRCGEAAAGRRKRRRRKGGGKTGRKSGRPGEKKVTGLPAVSFAHLWIGGTSPFPGSLRSYPPASPRCRRGRCGAARGAERGGRCCPVCRRPPPPSSPAEVGGDAVPSRSRAAAELSRLPLRSPPRTAPGTCGTDPRSGPTRGRRNGASAREVGADSGGAVLADPLLRRDQLHRH